MTSEKGETEAENDLEKSMTSEKDSTEEKHHQQEQNEIEQKKVRFLNYLKLDPFLGHLTQKNYIFQM